MASNTTDFNINICHTPLGVQESDNSAVNIDISMNIIDESDDDSVIITMSIPGQIPGTRTPSAQPHPLRMHQTPVIRITRLQLAGSIGVSVTDGEAEKENEDEDDDESESEDNSSGEEYVPNEEEEILSDDD